MSIQPNTQLPLAREFDDVGAALRRDAKREDAKAASKPTPQVAALPGMTPLGLKPKRELTELPEPGKVYTLISGEGPSIARGDPLADCEVTVTDVTPAGYGPDDEPPDNVTPIRPTLEPVSDYDAAPGLAAKAAGKRVPVGTVYVWSWGYDQTNIDWYEVVAHKGKTMITLRKIASQVVADHTSAFEVVARPGSYLDNEAEFSKRPGHDQDIKMGDWGSYAHVWGGGAMSETAPGWGH